MMCLTLCLLAPCVAHAQPPAAPQPTPTREIYIPFDALNVVLEGQKQRVFLTRQEYDELLAKAQQRPMVKTPHDAAILSADYTGTVEEGRARLTGTLTIDVLADGLHALPLELSGVGLRSAKLDGKPAPLGRNDQQKPVLFVEGRGRHTLELEMLVPLQATAALQTLNFQVPTPPSSQLRLTVPGNVEVKSGAEVIERVVDDAESLTRLTLLPKQGAMSLVMTLNNKLLRKTQVVVARSVLVDEVTAAYERLHASISLGVLHGAVNRFRFVTPPEFEVTEVTSPLLANWAVTVDADGAKILEARLNEPASETVVLNISAVRAPAKLEGWSWPKLTPLDVAGQVAVVGLLLEDRLKAQNVTATGLVPIDTAVLSAAMPASVFQAEPGAPSVRPIVAYYAPQAAFDLSASFDRPESRVNVTTNVLLTLDDTRHQARGSFALLPEVEKLFAVDFSVPAGWQVTEVTDAAGTKLPQERYESAGGTARIHVPLPAGVPPGQTYNLFFQAVHTPADWLTDWTSQQTAFPVFAVDGAARDVGAIAVHTLDDLRARPEMLTDLTPLDENEKGKYGLAGVATELAYRYDGPGYAAALIVERTAPRITARAYSFLRIESAGLTAHYELVYDIREARTRRLSLRLPASTPASLSIVGLDGIAVSETTSELVGDKRRWTALLAERRQGQVRLAVDFEARMSITDRAEQGLPREFALPLIEADGVAYQSGLVAVEGSAELDVQITGDPRTRKVDVGELVDAQYQPGRRLLGAFGYVGDTSEVKVSVFRRPGHALPPAIVQRAELVTLVSTSGLSQTAARYQLRTKDQFLELELPPGSQLWSTWLDGKPGQPQQEGGRLLLSLPAAAEDVLRDLQVVYETPDGKVGLWGTLDLPAPRLLLRGATGQAAREVPVADLVWHLHLPHGYYVSKTHGTVFTDQLAQRRMPLARIGETLIALGGGTDAMNMLTLGDRNLALVDRSDSISGSRATIEGKFAEVEGEVAATPPQADATTGKVDSFFAPSRRTLPQAATVPEDKPAEAPSAAVTAAPAPRAPPSPAAPSAPPPLVPDEVKKVGEGDEKAEGGKRSSGRYWALEGLRSLKIELDRRGDSVTFNSLGVEPRLNATLVHRQRIGSLAWGVALLVGFVGLCLTRRPTGVKVRYVVAILLVTAIVPLATDWFEELAEVFDTAFIAACFLVPYYVVASMAMWAARQSQLRVAERTATTAALALAIIMLGAQLATAQAPASPSVAEMMAELDKLIATGKPVDLPADAVIIPYDAALPLGERPRLEKLLVPYDKYVELWNRAYPDKKLQARPLPASYALAGAVWQTSLGGGDSLLLTGQIEIDVYTTTPVEIPLALDGGVLVKAELDGQPARLRVPDIAPIGAAGDGVAGVERSEPPARVAPAGGEPAARPQPPMVVLHASGQGRKRLELAIRLKLERQGGWRVVAGRLPTAPATQLAVRVPDAGTEVRLGEVLDRTSYETKAAGETIETALSADGVINLQWRPKVGEAQVDRSLTVNSTALLDVREDGLRLEWQLKMEFRRGLRESFTLGVPNGYLVEKVLGANVRGWQLKPGEERQQLEVTLLKAARDAEQLTLLLSRRGAVAAAKPEEITAPVVTVDDAVLHHGLLAVRRSPLLELRTLESSGLTRTDAPMDMTPAAGSLDDSPLGVRPYQAYQFIATTYKLVLSASTLSPAAAAEVQSVLKITEREATLESRIELRVQGRPLYRARFLLPTDFKLERVVAPGEHQWAVTDQDGRQVLSVYLAAGQQTQFAIVIAGTLPRPPQGDALPLPNLQVLDVERQEGQIVVQVDPAYDVRAESLQNAESLLLVRTYGWLQAEQRPLARLALGYRTADYSGTLRVTARMPRVRCFTVTNVLVTGRTIEETILLEFTIREAGIRELSFLLPESLKDARVSAPLLRQKTVTTVDEGPPPANVPGVAGVERSEPPARAAPAGGEPAARPQPPAVAPKLVRFRLEFQDEVMDQLRVLVEHDRLLTGETHTAPIPTVETGETDHRYVTLESAGRDEVLVDEPQGLEVLTRQQAQWRTLANLLGSQITQAYHVRDDAAAPRLTFHTKDRELVETVGARIGLAETLLIVDASGAYRAAVNFRVENTTEQFLDVRLPDGAELWTVRVAGEAVKPTEVPAATSPQQVRIPLIKTAAGDQDYAVVLKYGGRLPKLSSFSQVRFPLVRTLNINVELSQVRLRLPETHRWFGFGGSMRHVQDQADLTAGYLSYRGRQIERLSQILSSSSSYSRARATNNLKQLQLEQSAITSYEALPRNEEFRLQLESNARALEAGQQLADQQQAEFQAPTQDNRQRLNDLFESQQTSRAKNVVTDVGGNFKQLDGQQQPAQPGADGRFDRSWLERNKLDISKKPADPGKGESRVAGGRAVGGRQPGMIAGEGKAMPDAAKPQQAAQPQAAGVAQGKAKEALEQEAGERGRQREDLPRKVDDVREQTRRYQQRLEEQPPQLQAQQPSQPRADDRPFQVFGRDTTLPQPPAAPPAGPPVMLASLDVELPQGGTGYREVLFTTPRGEVEITARAIARPLGQRLTRLAWVLAVLAAVWLAGRMVREHGGHLFASPAIGVVLALAGLASMLTCVLPIAGVLAVLGGVTILVRWHMAARQKAR